MEISSTFNLKVRKPRHLRKWLGYFNSQWRQNERQIITLSSDTGDNQIFWHWICDSVRDRQASRWHGSQDWILLLLSFLKISHILMIVNVFISFSPWFMWKLLLLLNHRIRYSIWYFELLGKKKVLFNWEMLLVYSHCYVH